MDEFIEHLHRDADASFPYDVDYMNAVDDIADQLEEIWEREKEKIEAMREVATALANVILTPQMERAAEYGGGMIPDRGWLAWLRQMQEKAKAALNMQNESEVTK